MKSAGESTTAQVVRPSSVQPLPGPLQSSHDALVAHLADEMARAWHNNECSPVEHYLDRHPHLKSLTPAVIDLVYEEICLRRERGAPLRLSDIARRFPTFRRQIAVLLDCAEALEAGAAFPSVGQSLGDFRLVEEIGRGGQGRVFLATESTLGDRPVVLKITPRTGHEHLSLARLQHTHIVPLLSVLDEAETDWRVLCMPYFGGLTLAAILTALADQSPAQRKGHDIAAILERARAEAATDLPRNQAPTWSFLQ